MITMHELTYFCTLFIGKEWLHFLFIQARHWHQVGFSSFDLLLGRHSALFSKWIVLSCVFMS